MEYSWPLSKPQFSTWDKLRLAHYVTTNDRWTQSDVVAQFEIDMAKYVGAKHAVFTSSGSTANTLLAMYLQDKAETGRDVIVCPSTTWITSVSPFLREGFQVDFIDINLADLSMDLDKLHAYLAKNHSRVACVFVTSLIGFTPDIYRLQKLSKMFNVRVMMDNCENTLGRFAYKNVSSFFTSTTSTYFGHQLQSVEGGFVFTNDTAEYEYLLMARNHGMVRHLPPESLAKYRNEQVDARFDFNLLGNNFRNTNINAFLGMCDLKRADKYFILRRELYYLYQQYLHEYLILPYDGNFAEHAPFCLPLIFRPEFVAKKKRLLNFCDKMSIETRPIISGNLLRQACLKQDNYLSFANSEYLHQNGFYIGLHGSSTVQEVQTFAEMAVSLIKSE
jgi:CDP-6-deoxy-D-xylo-4-hexulose-3-dehydrase